MKLRNLILDKSQAAGNFSVIAKIKYKLINLF